MCQKELISSQQKRVYDELTGEIITRQAPDAFQKDINLEYTYRCRTS